MLRVSIEGKVGYCLWSYDFRSDIDECPFGPLTQRLVSALISENAINSVDEDSMHTSIANVTAGKIIYSTSPYILCLQFVFVMNIRNCLLFQGCSSK